MSVVKQGSQPSFYDPRGAKIEMQWRASSLILYKAHPDELGLAVGPTNAKGADPFWMTLTLQTTVATIATSSRGS